MPFFPLPPLPIPVPVPLPGAPSPGQVFGAVADAIKNIEGTVSDVARGAITRVKDKIEEVTGLSNTTIKLANGQSADVQTEDKAFDEYVEAQADFNEMIAAQVSRLEKAVGILAGASSQPAGGGMMGGLFGGMGGGGGISSLIMLKLLEDEDFLGGDDDDDGLNINSLIKLSIISGGGGLFGGGQGGGWGGGGDFWSLYLATKVL